MKLSLRAQKLTSSNSGASSQHNDRTTFAQSVDSEKSKNNYHYKSEHFQDTTEKLWQYIKSDFVQKKELKLIAKNKRFLKRNSTKTTKDKNGEKNTTQVETSIAREFLIQIGNENKHLTNSKSLKAYKKIMEEIAKRYKLTILQADFHADEKVPHLHFIATTYDFSTGEFSKEFNKPNSYEKMQKDIFKFVQKELKIELEGYEKKTCIEADYIAPAVYRKNKPLLEKAKEYCKKNAELAAAGEQKVYTKEDYQAINKLKKALNKDTLQEIYKEYLKLQKELLEKEKEVFAPAEKYKTKAGKPVKNVDVLKHLEKKLSEAQESIKALKASNDTLKSDLKRSEQDMSVLSTKNKSLSTANSSLKAEISEKDKTISFLKEKSAATESGEVVQLKEKVQELLKENRELKKEVSYLRSMHEKNTQQDDEYEKLLNESSDAREEDFDELLKKLEQKESQNPREN